MASPLIHDDIEFHNAAALEPLNGLPGLVPVRVPADVRRHLNTGARLVATDSVGTELRFVTESNRFRLALQAHDNDMQVDILCGGFLVSTHLLPAGQTRSLNVVRPEQLAMITDEALRAGAFSPDVWRVQFHRFTCSYLGLDTFGERRPPRPEETPALRWLAYGSSITHNNTQGYPFQAARRLRVDVLDKGLSGSCAVENALADYFAEEEEWDFATLELGINIRGQVTPEDFEGRVHYMVERLRRARPTAPLALITHFTNRQHFPSAKDDNPLAVERQLAYDAILRTIAAERTADNVHLVEGRELLPDFDGLTADLIHPGPFGHIQMGEHLAARLAPLIAPLR